MGRALFAVVALIACACGSDSDGADAGNRDALARPDSTPIVCDSETPTTLNLASAFEAGGSDNLNFAGVGSWVAQGGASGPPGEILYIEAYTELLAGSTTSSQDGFLAWRAECPACVFIGLDCPAYSIPFEGADPRAPSDCGSLFMLDAGQIVFNVLDTDPVIGTVAGQIDVLSGNRVRFVEVGRSGEPGTTGGFGERIPDGNCITVDSPIAFSGSWNNVPPPDAGILDAALAP